MLNKIDMNDGWEYLAEYEDIFITGGRTSKATEAVRLPHMGTVLPFNYTDENAYQKISGYRRRFHLPRLVDGTRLFITFSGAAHEATLYINGEKIAQHRCGYTAFSSELTKFAVEGENVIALRLDSNEDLNQPPFGNIIDYLTYSGLYRGCYIEMTSSCFIADVFVSGEGSSVRSELIIAGKGCQTITQTLLDSEGQFIAAVTEDVNSLEFGKSAFPHNLPVSEDECISVACMFNAEPVKIVSWDIDKPVLYSICFELRDTNGKLLDKKTVRFGFRKVEFRADGFYLNGKKLRLRGLNRHQSFPYAGYAMPDSVQRHDADILKDELGLNAVRTSHYPQSQAFIDRCDEIGLLVFTEIPGWQHIGDYEWKDIAVRNVEEMVAQYRNHPSIMLWGVRINESQDDDGLYMRTNMTARSLDFTRQTGGVRNFIKSHQLEDVYTYNDFSHTGDNKGLVAKETAASDISKPYLVTEFNGHMFPTKSYDCEEHRLEHALRHAGVLDAMYGSSDIAGCFGWCAFDYNTHKEFGSGDRICYHGVMDMFRNPKPAAWVYASQSEREPFLEVSTSIDNGDHPAGILGDVYAFTNADFVRLYKDNVLIRDFYPDTKLFPNLPHPPVKIEDCLEGWGAGISAWRFEAITGGETVAVSEKGYNPEVILRLDADKTVLRENGGYDAACVRICALDGNGNRLWYFSEPVILCTEGPIEIIGPSIVSLRGGAAGTYIKTRGEKGKAKLIVKCAASADNEMEFAVEVPMRDYIITGGI